MSTVIREISLLCGGESTALSQIFPVNAVYMTTTFSFLPQATGLDLFRIHLPDLTFIPNFDNAFLAAMAVPSAGFTFLFFSRFVHF
jgi:hypothetical protein